MSCSHILVYLTCFIALLGINKVICCQYCNVTMYPFCVLANVVSQYKPGYYRSPVAQTDALCLFRAADAHCMGRGLNSKSVTLLLLIRALNVARSISSQDLRRLLMCKSRSRGPQERGEVQMRCRGRARVTAGPCGPGTAPKMGVPGGA